MLWLTKPKESAWWRKWSGQVADHRWPRTPAFCSRWAWRNGCQWGLQVGCRAKRLITGARSRLASRACGSWSCRTSISSWRPEDPFRETRGPWGWCLTDQPTQFSGRNRARGVQSALTWCWWATTCEDDQAKSGWSESSTIFDKTLWHLHRCVCRRYVFCNC